MNDFKQILKTEYPVMVAGVTATINLASDEEMEWVVSASEDPMGLALLSITCLAAFVDALRVQAGRDGLRILTDLREQLEAMP